MCWPAQPAKCCGMKLTEKSELNKPQMQITSGNSSRKVGQNYLQSLMKRILRICESVKAARGGHFDELKIQDFFFNLILFNVAQRDCI